MAQSLDEELNGAGSDPMRLPPSLVEGSSESIAGIHDFSLSDALAMVDDEAIADTMQFDVFELLLLEQAAPVSALGKNSHTPPSGPRGAPTIASHKRARMLDYTYRPASGGLSDRSFSSGSVFESLPTEEPMDDEDALAARCSSPALLSGGSPPKRGDLPRVPGEVPSRRLSSTAAGSASTPAAATGNDATDAACTMPTDDADAMDSSCFNSPKLSRAAASTAELSAPGTGEQTRTAAQLAPEERAHFEKRVLDLEMALGEAERQLTAAQLETERIQAGAAGESVGEIVAWSDEEVPWEVSDHGPSDDEATEGGVGASGTSAVNGSNNAFTRLMQGQKEKKAAEDAKAAAQTAARERTDAIKKLKLPTEIEPETDHWNLKSFQSAEEHMQEKRSKQVRVDTEKPPKLRKGKHGWRSNRRHGLAGAVRYWANGSRHNVVKMLMGLIKEFQIEDEIRKQLFQKTRRQTETDTYIVDRLVAAVNVLKGCQTEQQRRDFRLALALVAPTRTATGDQEGMARRVSARLRVQRGKRSKKYGERPRAFEAAITSRADFDHQASRFHLTHGPLRPGQQHSVVGEPLQPGERVLTQHNGEAELARFTADGGCVLIFRVGDLFREVAFKDSFGKGKGSAGLRRIPPSLSAPPRALSSNATSDATRKAIYDHVASVAPTSPHQRDIMRRRVGPFLIEEKPAFIQSDTEEAMFELFQKERPDIAIKLRQYKYELPWNMKKAYRSTCLDRCDVNFDWHRQGLNVAMEVLAPLLSPPSDDAEGAAEAEAAPADPLLRELSQFAALTSRTEIGNALVCMPALVGHDDQRLGDSTAKACLDGMCNCCGFQRFWSKGLRARVVQPCKDGEGGKEELCEGVSPLWGREMSWDTIKPGGDGNGDSAEDSDLRHTVSGTVYEFLDACEEAHRGWVPHRFHAMQSKKAETESHQNLTPGKLKNDSDWSENGEIVVKHQMQSEYWSIKHYSLLISMTCFLVSSTWKDRASPLEAGAEVTVQPEDAPVDSIAYVKGSYFGMVVEGTSEAGEGVEYIVKQPNGTEETVPRRRLRHRVWHRVAFLGVTNEKQHVAVTTQAFFSRQLEFWRIWKKEGRAAALAFAAHDRATVASAADGAAVADAAATATADADADDSADAADAAAPADVDAAVAADAAAAKAAATTRATAAALRAANPEFAQFLDELDHEQFWAWVGHSDNATHFKSSGNLHWWSNQQDTLDFISSIWIQYGCPGKGKGPWDGLGAVVKTKVRNDITCEKCQTRAPPHASRPRSRPTPASDMARLSSHVPHASRREQAHSLGA